MNDLIIKPSLPVVSESDVSLCVEYGDLHIVIIKNTHLTRTITGSFEMDFGWGNGYVILPEGHPFYEKHYDDIPVDCHGGLTFAEDSQSMSKTTGGIPNGWMIGFDTARRGDTLERWSMQAVFEHTIKLADAMNELVASMLESSGE